MENKQPAQPFVPAVDLWPAARYDLRSLLGVRRTMSFDLLTSLGEMVSTEPDVLEKHSCDWSNVNRQRPLPVIRPRTVADVSSALRLCHQAGIAVVPQGGLTGLAGGATPQAGQVVL